MPYRSVSNRKSADAHEEFKSMEIVLEVKAGATPPLRPRVPVSTVQTELYDLMESCWDELPINRPTFLRIRVLFRTIVGKSGDNVVEQLIRNLDAHARDLEKKVDAHTKLYLEEKARFENLITLILPRYDL